MSQIFSAFGWLFNTVISRPLGWILGLCYHVLPNYGLALILFTLITRVLLAPLAIKQQKSQAEMVRLQPQIQKIQKRYANNKEKLNSEMMALYQEEGYNPMGGCLPLLIQMPILFGLFNVIYRPLSYMVGLSQSQIAKVVSALWPEIKTLGGSALSKYTDATAIHYNQIEILAAHAMHGNMDKLSFLPGRTVGLDFNFLGLDLSATPHLGWSWLLLVPVVCYLTSLLSTWYTMQMSQKTMPQSGQAINPAGMNKSMLLVMPLVSAYFATTVPAGVGFYWIITNLFMLLQTWALYKFYNPVKLAERAQEVSDRRREARLAAHPELARRDEDEEPAQDEPKPGAGKAQGAKKAQGVQSPRPARTGKKKSKKQLMEENRRRLAASRAKEQHDSDRPQ